MCASARSGGSTAVNVAPMTTHSDLPPMLGAILHAARDKFAGHDWAAVEEHIRKAWNALAHDQPWEVVRGAARRVWESARD